MEQKKELPPKYYLVAGKNTAGVFCFDLSYSEESGDGAFPPLCIDILKRLFTGYWIKMEIDDPCNTGFRLPDGQISGERELFADAFRSYLQGCDARVLFDGKGRMMTLSFGVEEASLHSYLSDVPPNFHVRTVRFYGYHKQTSLGLTHDSRKLEDSNWSMMAQYGELQDDLNILVRDAGTDIGEIQKTLQQLCSAYGRELELVFL